MAYSKLLPRRGTRYEWETINPILEMGEFVIEVPDSGVGTGFSKFKIGDGQTPYRSLPYALDGSAASSIDGGSPSAFSIIQMRRANATTWQSVNPILNDGEPGYDSTNRSIKVGDGVHTWNQLDFIKTSEFVSNVYDFGDETASTVSAAERIVEDNNYPADVLPDGWDDHINDTGGIDIVSMSSAGMSDLLDSGVDTVEVESEYVVKETASEDTKTEEVTEVKSSKSTKKKSSATDTQTK